MDLTLFGCYQGLKALKFDITSDWTCCLSILQALISKRFTRLEELRFVICEFEGKGRNLHDDIFKALSTDAYSNLRILNITFPKESSRVDEDYRAKKRSDACHYLADAIGSGKLRHLQELSIIGDHAAYDSGSVLKSMAKGKCPNLVNVEFDGFICDDTDLNLETTTAGAFLSGAFDSVKALRNACDFPIILWGIEARQYPSMKELIIWYVDNNSLASLGRALAQGSFPNLETLIVPDVSPNSILRGIQEARRRSLMPNLRDVAVLLFVDFTEILHEELVDKQLVTDFRKEFPTIILRHITL